MSARSAGRHNEIVLHSLYRAALALSCCPASAGFEVIRENYRKERGDYKLDLKLGDCELEIFGIPGSPKRPSYPEACGLRHLAFRVSDMDEAVSWLHGLGIETEPVRIDEFTQKKMTFFKDPDGLPLELHE